MANGQAGERYLLGGENLLWREIMQALADALGVRLTRRTLGPRMAGVLATTSEAIAAATRTRALITRETARTASHVWRYSSEKATRELGWTPRPFRETAARIASALG
jgi:dihydroflavonol-4-reductase